MIAKKHFYGGRMVLALCDSSLLGKKFEEGKLRLDLSGGFYRGEEVSEKMLESMVSRAYILNAVGEESVVWIITRRLAKKDDIKRISDVPHVQIIINQ
ncbi:DUF424 domain-containing protein [Candidatus Woesearchaeota archaeon]|nr:DUF424 domain-containing protein [Candidatus Woesearchaeota archaeon]